MHLNCGVIFDEEMKPLNMAKITKFAQMWRILPPNNEFLQVFAMASWLGYIQWSSWSKLWGSEAQRTCKPANLGLIKDFLMMHDSFSEVEIKDLFYISCLIFFFKSCNFIIVPPYLLTTTNSIDSLTSLWKVKRTWGNFRNFLGIFWQVDRKSATTNW